MQCSNWEHLFQERKFLSWPICFATITGPHGGIINWYLPYTVATYIYMVVEVHVWPMTNRITYGAVTRVHLCKTRPPKEAWTTDESNSTIARSFLTQDRSRSLFKIEPKTRVGERMGQRARWLQRTTRDQQRLPGRRAGEIESRSLEFFVNHFENLFWKWEIWSTKRWTKKKRIMD